MTLLFVALAHAADPDALQENTVSGAAPPVTAPAAAPALDLPPVEAPEGNTKFSARSLRAAELLHIDVELADRARRSLERVYARDYEGAEAEFAALGGQYPTTGMGPAGLAVLYQARMFENFDFRFEAEYHAAHDEALRQIALGQQAPGNEAIEWILRAGMGGIEGIHQMRRGEYLAALAAGVDAVTALSEAKKAAPGFVDPALGDGMYLYWRTVIARASPLIPDGPDEREEGRALLKSVEKDGVLFGPAATLALTYSFIEEGDLRNALARCLYGRMKYPDNVINNMTAGRVLTSMQRYPEARAMFADVLRVDPDNQRVHYHLGVVWAREKKPAEAEAEFRTYLTFSDPPPEALGQAGYRLGLVLREQGRPEEARAAWETAVSVGHNAAARQALGSGK